VNRPFYAFGVLLLLLALAMYAVSSTSRSTAVQSQPAGGAGSLITPAPRLGTIYVVVLPAAEEPQPVATAQPEPCIPSPARQTSGLRPVLLLPAIHDAAPVLDAAEYDCLSHYDAAYDRLVYDARTVRLPDSAAEPSFRPQDDAAGDWIALFHEVAAAPRANLATAPWHRSAWRWLRQQALLMHELWLRPISRGALNWAVANVERVGWRKHVTAASAAIDGPSYAVLMDTIVADSTDAPATVTSEAANAGVRSGDWMLHFAVSSLSQLGLTLQQAAAELQRLASGASAEP